LNLPNVITLSRVIFIIPIVIFLSSPKWGWNALAAFCFFVASFTDFADGFIARSRGEVTKLGKMLDPLADKLLIVGVLIPLVGLGRVPSWLAVVILAREFAVTGLRGMVALQGVSIPAGKGGKAKTFLYTVSLILIMLHLQTIGLLLLLIGASISIYSGYQYFASCKEMLMREEV